MAGGSGLAGIARRMASSLPPHWDSSVALIERFNALPPALLRHAEVSSRLRDNGWRVIDHGDAGRSHAAA
jgi:hypothetical protein